jgi:hypothetical protein
MLEAGTEYTTEYTRDSSFVLEEQHPAERLWERHRRVGPYPSCVVPVPVPIAGTAFFPGGYGLWHPEGGHPLPPMPIGGVMVLGHDFHSVAGYKASYALGHEPLTQPTWRGLLKVLGGAGVLPSDCFFTNVYMGLRQGTATTGPFPGRHDAEFVRRCQRFLAEQLAAQRPSVVLTLGVYTPRLLAQLSADLDDWRAPGSLKALDQAGPVRRGVQFDGAGVTASVAALTHPCFRHASIRHREYGGVRGAAAEAAMLADVLADSPSSLSELADR